MTLEVSGLHAAYGKATVLRGVDLRLPERQVVALLGRNGMGKTTLMRSISGLHPPAVTAGSVRLKGEEILRLSNHAIARRGLALVPQGRRVFGSLTVEENLMIGFRRNEGGWDLERVYGLFPRLEERSNQRGGVLSGGEQQMLAIGRALMTNPVVVLMDEPSEGLAPTVRDMVRDCLLLLKEDGQTVLLAEQNVDLAVDVADRVAVIGESGEIGWEGDPAHLREDPALMNELVGL
ncbi:MAG TPA: ABC transporter ATP-binding protein [Acidimicrobiia bacterium]|nr:ABC transporter ATP-binding protein [Acidimicrobiia bacterium]